MAYKYTVEKFDSIDQLLKTLDKRPNSPIFGSGRHSSQTDDRSSTKTKSYAEAVELVRYGWDEPVNGLKAELTKLQAKSNVTTQKARPRNSVVGYAPCVPAAIMGLPESMIATERVPSKVKAVTIIYANSATAGTNADTFIKAGSVILKLINDLELKGYRVRLVCEFRCSMEGSEIHVGRVTIKDWRQPLDLKKIAFPIAHPSMMRRFGFKLTETCPELKASWKWSYGSTLGNNWKYDKQVAEYKANNLLTENEYYTTLQLVEECRFDTEKVMVKAGIALK